MGNYNYGKGNPKIVDFDNLCDNNQKVYYVIQDVIIAKKMTYLMKLVLLTNKHPYIVNTILDKYIQKYPKEMYKVNNIGWTPLMIAISNGNIETVKKLLEIGSCPNSPKFRGRSPLMVAARYGGISIVKLLCNHDEIDIHECRWILDGEVAPTYYVNALYEAVVAKDIDVIEYLRGLG